MKRLTILLLIFLAFTSCSTTETTKNPVRVPLFEMGESGSQFYRIPALVKAADGALVAIADKRGEALGDLPNIITIVSKRSTDNGKTWSDMSIVAQGDTIGKCGYGDAVPVPASAPAGLPWRYCCRTSKGCLRSRYRRMRCS